MGHAWLQTLSLLCLLLGSVTASGWDPDQLEVFDVVEEVDQNFYQLMNISQDANITQIKKAFRNLSLVTHPDKNDSPDAEVKFRNLVSVYDVLRDANKRKHYDDVLVNGLPNWRSAVYYYRHYRKMGLAEMVAIVFVLVTVGQYLVGWASYFEQKYTHEQVYQAKIEKRKKKLTKKGQNVEDLFETFDLPKPSITNTLPIQIPRLIYSLIVGIPEAIRNIGETIRETERQKDEQRRQQIELELEIEQKRARDREARKNKPQRFTLEERDESELPKPPLRTDAEKSGENETEKVRITGGLWTDDDLAELVQLVKKFPGGTTERWEKIADHMNRSVPEVTYMAAKLKDNCYRLPQDEVPAPLEVEQPRKLKTRGGKAGEGTLDDWSQTQQKALECALAKFPKGPADRWDKIAKCVPDKSKEECILRYKHLAELVRKKKETNGVPEHEHGE